MVLGSGANAINDDSIYIVPHIPDATFGMVIHPNGSDEVISEDSFHYEFIEEDVGNDLN